MLLLNSLLKAHKISKLLKKFLLLMQKPESEMCELLPFHKMSLSIFQANIYLNNNHNSLIYNN